MTPAHLDAGMRQHFSLFLMKVFQQLHPGEPPLRLAWYIKAICHALVQAAETPGSRLVVSVPPRHLKSIAAAVALPAWLLGRDPTTKFMVATYSDKLARTHSQHCRQVVQSDWYQRIFPQTRIADGGNTLNQITTTQGGGRLAVTVGGTVTGLGADCIIVDDCLKPEDARSDTLRQQAREWFDGTLSTRLNSLANGVMISIAQRLHEDDLPAHLLEKGWDHLCLTAIATKQEDIAIGPGVYHRRTPGSLLDREGHTRDVLEQTRVRLGAPVFAAQYQQDPVAPEGNLIRMEWFGTYDEAPTRDECVAVVQSWDTAQSEEPTADFSVCTTWGYHGKKWYLLDVLRGRFAYPDLRRAVLRQRRDWRPTAVVIEDANAGKSIWQEFCRSGEFRPTMWQVSRDKESRLIGVTGLLDAGMCLLPADAPWLSAFRSELKAFPSGRHDDQVDSMTQFLEYYLRWSDWLLTERDSRGRALWIKRPPARVRS